MSTVLAVSPGRRSNEVLGALSVPSKQLAAKGPNTVPAVLRGYAAANKMVNGGKDWATVRPAPAPGPDRCPRSATSSISACAARRRL
ncbi:hypothetical protein ACGF07_07995 [Kitasatospora sp. NPDC048194]|uniref:hypothetical protein n=1 Tax=Kitasatospora sp. NPDC048194 TaxID=3364045 RepID=UPI00372148B5